MFCLRVRAVRAILPGREFRFGCPDVRSDKVRKSIAVAAVGLALWAALGGWPIPRRTADAPAQSGRSTAEVETITLAGHTYAFPRDYISISSPNSPGRRSGILLRVALPSFDPWWPLPEDERARTDWANVLLHDGVPSGSLDRLLAVFAGNPAYTAPKIYAPALPPSPPGTIYNVFVSPADAPNEFVMQCGSRLAGRFCSLHYAQSSIQIKITFPKKYFSKIFEMQSATELLISRRGARATTR